MLHPLAVAQSALHRPSKAQDLPRALRRVLGRLDRLEHCLGIDRERVPHPSPPSRNSSIQHPSGNERKRGSCAIDQTWCATAAVSVATGSRRVHETIRCRFVGAMLLTADFTRAHLLLAPAVLLSTRKRLRKNPAEGPIPATNQPIARTSFFVLSGSAASFVFPPPLSIPSKACQTPNSRFRLNLHSFAEDLSVLISFLLCGSNCFCYLTSFLQLLLLPA